MDWIKVIFFLHVFLFSAQLVAQNKQLNKANKRYQIKKYAEAIPFYEAGLKKNPNLNAKVRLAYCYRINNNIQNAVNLYSEIIKHKRARPITWYYYGESLMSQGKYDEAKVWLTKYTEKKPDDLKGWTLIESIDKIQTIAPYYEVKNIEAFAHNSEEDDSAPVFFRNGIAFSSDRKTGAKIMKKKSSFTGRDFLSIYLSKRDDIGSYKSPHQISRKINDLNKNTGTIAISPDETSVVFSKNSAISNRKNQYSLMLYQAELTEEGKFKNIKLMEFCNNNSNYMHPTFSPDGKTLFFISDKSGVGGTDIFYSKIGNNGWSQAINLGTPINTTANEGFPFMSSDGKLFFSSKGHTSYGGFDIFVSQQDLKGNWSQPINIGLPINSAADDISIYLSKDLTKGMFASSREGGDDDIYLFDIEGMYERVTSDLFTSKLTSHETFVSNLEDEIIVLEPISENKTNNISEEIEIPIETLKELNKLSQNHRQESVYIPIETFESKDEIESNIKKKSKEKGSLFSGLENSSKLFQEGLASLDSPITDFPLHTKDNSSDDNIAKMREYLKFQSPQEETIFTLEKVKFESKKYHINDNISSYLEELVKLMNEFHKLKIEINAHTPSFGNDRENMVLSIKRATATAGYLIRKGIETDRIKVMGYGETKLINHCVNDVNCSKEDHKINQRIELKIINQ
ncbi:MAG: OmpA family protein [Saprospiraceae bacterium]|nr:OmpA family protein [Saprospiraceae bacterium]